MQIEQARLGDKLTLDRQLQRLQQDYDCEFIPMPWHQNEAEQLKTVSKV